MSIIANFFWDLLIVLLSCSALTAGLGADEDVFDLIKQEVQRDAQGKKKRAAGRLSFSHICFCHFATQGCPRTVLRARHVVNAHHNRAINKQCLDLLVFSKSFGIRFRKMFS